MISPCLVAVFALAVSDFARVESLRPSPSQNQENQTQPADQNTVSQPSFRKEQSKSGEGQNKKGNQTSNIINTVSTAIMALFTIALFTSTHLLWKSGKEHSERELRAYVQVSKACITYIASDMSPEAVLSIKNFGQTPAYNCRTSITIAVRDFPSSSFPLQTQLPDTSCISPDDFTTSRIAFESILTQNSYADILIGKKAIYVICQTLYRDAFDKERVSNFRGYYRGGEPDDPSRHHDLRRALNQEPLELTRAQEGNECT